MWKPSNTANTATVPTVEPPARPAYTPPSSSGQEESPAGARTNNPVTLSQDQATIGKSLLIKGEISGSESLYVDGRIEGTVNLPGNRVTIGRNGVVAANITAREIVILGKVRGNLTASDRVDIRNEGSLTGDVVAQRISIEDGAFFKGGIDIRKPGLKAEAKAESTDEKSGTPTAVRA